MPPFDPTLPQSPGAPAGGAMPPRPPHPNVDPANGFQAQLLNRLRALSPQDKQSLVTGISPPAMAVLAKVLPELSHIMPGGARPAGPGAPGGAPPPPAPGGDVGDASAGPDDDEQPMAPPPPDGSTPLKPAGLQPKSKLAKFGS